MFTNSRPNFRHILQSKFKTAALNIIIKQIDECNMTNSLLHTVTKLIICLTQTKRCSHNCVPNYKRGTTQDDIQYIKPNSTSLQNTPASINKDNTEGIQLSLLN